MQYYACIVSTVIIFTLHCEASPLFIVNPFTTVSDGEPDNVSIYTTTARTSSAKIVTESPTVYQQIARNVLERIASHFVAPINGRYKGPTYTELEIVEDSTEDFAETDGNSADSDKEDEMVDKELINPKLIDSNPSYKVIPMGRSHPERIVLYSATTVKPSREIVWGEKDEPNLDDGESTGKDFTENGLFRVLELVASAITLLGGAFSALFRPAMTDSN